MATRDKSIPRSVLVAMVLISLSTSTPSLAQTIDSDRDGIPDKVEDRDRDGMVDEGETSPIDPCSDADRDEYCVTKEDLDSIDRGPRIPEPMVTDLVRGLGARRGELEFNVLALGSVSPRNQTIDWVTETERTDSGNEIGLAWAPEVEWAFANGWAFELELPFEQSTLQALKTAIQLTLGTALKQRFIHGLQVIGEWGVGAASHALIGYYLIGIRLDEVWTTQLMIGPQIHVERATQKSMPGAEASLSTFAELNDTLALGVELSAHHLAEHRLQALLMPQLRFRFSGHGTLQCGLGVQRTGHNFSPMAGARISVDY